MAKSNKTNTKKTQLLQALEKSLGVVTTACRSVGIDRSTFYDWYSNDADFQLKVDALQDVALDFAESQLFKQIQEGEVSSTIFYLKTKGKRRGYVERVEVEQKGKVKLTIGGKQPPEHGRTGD